MKILFNLTAVTFVILGLAACDNGIGGQIEKCVQAGLEANGPYKNNQEKAGVEIGVRSHCLNAAAGKS